MTGQTSDPSSARTGPEAAPPSPGNAAARLKDLERLLPQCLLADQLRIGWRVTHWLESHRRGESAPRGLDHWLHEARASIALRQRRRDRLPAITYPSELPIATKRDEIVAALRAHPVLVVAGETGSGKTTQLPKMCLEAGLGVRARIGCTQPRRLAALSLSRRLAEELQLEWGHEVGCKIRFSDRTGPETYVKFMTDGILLAEAQGDPVLSEYEAIILDEAHERSLNIDFLLGILKQLLARRSDLKLIITSATIDTQAFARHFNHAPIIEVSGRTYPVTTEYWPLTGTEAVEAELGEARAAEELTYVEAAVQAVERVVETTARGDVLVFLPAERDILETRDALQAWAAGRLELVPLFGRLSADDQQRVFAAAPRRKVVLATNIAETSLTVPGIHYVIDTGLARVSRYNPRTRTRRLPIEAVSQSSANQRQGRCGRVAAGVCIRLFAEADLQARPLYTQPEIQRANLAEVILRMQAFQLGEVETFPFLNPPAPAAIQGGYQLLQEIGALDAERRLTEVGQRLARLPVDPTIGRMILQAQQENALAPVLVIAAGLSIQDPRERPADRQEAANAAHRRFHHPRSDFLTLLNLWEAYHDPLETLKTQSQLRRFCRAHFLSYPRMREWRDIHAQLEEAVVDLGEPASPSHPPVRAAAPPGRGRPEVGAAATARRETSAVPAEPPAADPAYAAIHRSILTGLWSHVAQKKERNLYRLGGNREAMVFPGSGLFERTAEPRPGKPKKADAAEPRRTGPQPPWLVAGEIVETSRLFVRTVAEIDPQWVVELAPHLVRRAYLEPRWDAAAGRVVARERVTLNGLVVLERTVAYGQSHPREATEIFIQSALVEEGLADHFQTRAPRPPARPSAVVSRLSGLPSGSEANPTVVAEPPARNLDGLPLAYRFLCHNHQLRQKIEIWQTRLRHRLVPDLDAALAGAYTQRLLSVSSVPDLNRVVRERAAGDPGFLCLTAADLLGEHATEFDARVFPDTVAVGDERLPLSYAYAPGDDRDGVTVQLPFTLAQMIEPGLLDWAVPGLREPQILHLLQALPKDLRRTLMPLAPKAKEMAERVQPRSEAFLTCLIDFIRQHYRVSIPLAAWSAELLPAHLRPRLEIVGKQHEPLARGRNLLALRQQLAHHDTTPETEAWQRAVQQWERYGLKDWTVGDLPEHIAVANVAGFPLRAIPALHVEAGDICLRLFRKEADAAQAHQAAVPRLLESVLQRDLAWLEKDLRSLAKWRELYATCGSIEQLEVSAFENLRQHLFGPRPKWPRTAAAFVALAAEARAQVPGLATKLSEWTGDILKLRHAVLVCRTPYPHLHSDLKQLVPAEFLRYIPFERLRHVPRYLKAMLVRAERAAVNPVKDREKLERVQPHLERFAKLRGARAVTASAPEKLAACRWLLEELKVSVFAQELGTAEPVSPQRIERALAELQAANG